MKLRLVLLTVVVMSLVLTACGGSGDSSSDPVGVVKELVKAMEKLDVEQASKYMCEAHKSDLPNIEEGFAELEAMGIDPNDLLDAFNIKMSDMKYKETSKDGDKAVVHVSGKISMNADLDKLRSIFKKVLEGMGMEATDDMLDPMLADFTAEMGKEASIDSDVNLIKEDGKWVVCDKLDFLDKVGTGF